MLFDKLIILKENTPPKPLVRRIRDRPEWHLLKNPATEIHGRTRNRFRSDNLFFRVFPCASVANCTSYIYETA